MHAPENDHRFVLDHVEQRVWEATQDMHVGLTFDAKIQLGGET